MNVTEPLIQLRDVGLCYEMGQKFYGKTRTFWALKNIDLDVFQGETLGVVGRNGAGKTSLLKVISGIISPDTGRFRIQPCRISLLSLQLGFMPQLTGRENIILNGLFLGCSRKEIEARMDQIIEFSELGPFISEPINTYSTGMKARLGFSVAIHTDPDVLLVDETLGVGDEEFRKKSTEKMKERIRSNMTVVLVSHQNAVLESLCDRLVWIENGKTVMQGPTDEVLASYQNAAKQQQGKSKPIRP